MTSAAPIGAKTGAAAKAASSTKTATNRLRPSYWPVVLPALITVGAVIVFPWVFTLWMSTNQWQLGGEQSFVGFDNYLRLATDMRFWESMLQRWCLTANCPCAGCCAVSSSCQ